MPERRRRPDLTPRWLTIAEAAQYLGHSPSWLTPERLSRLQETGFPAVDPSLDRIDREGIDDWSDRRSRRTSAPTPFVDGGAPTASSEPSNQPEADPWVTAARGLRHGKIGN